MTNDEKKIDRWLQLISQGRGKWTSAIEVGLAPVSLRQRLVEDPALAEEVRAAEELALEPTISSLRSIASDPDHPQVLQAAKLLLQARHDDYSPKPKAQEEAAGTTVNVQLDAAGITAMIDAARGREKELTSGHPGPVIDARAEPRGSRDVPDLDQGEGDST